MPPRSENPDELGDFKAPAETRETGEFTRAFREKKLSANDSSSQPGSLTQALGGLSKPTASEAEKPPQPPRQDSPASDDSFTSAFDGVNAFTRDLGDLREDPFKTAPTRKRFDPASPPSSGTFTRIFGAGEGVLTPAGPGGDAFPKSSIPKAPIVKDTNFSSARNPSSEEQSSFTDAFRGPAPSQPAGTNRNGGSFTDQFPSPSSWPSPEPPIPPPSSRTYSPGRGDDALPPGNPEHPAIPHGGFTRLVNSFDSDVTPVPDATRPSTPLPSILRRPLSDPNFGPPASSNPDATIAFNPRHSETEFAPPEGMSAHTRVIEGSRLRSLGDPYGAPSPPPAAAGPAVPAFAIPTPATPAFQAPPIPVQHPHAPQPPAWGQPQMPTPIMPQPPALPAPPQPAPPPTLGDKLVSFLPFILTLTVINFLGLLAVLIILFATRK